ncbi:Hypothetical protein R9X50_00327800 [Acrodontium crateriforme]|uniref:histidine kinase n=1 Tax=Acrodontium crateriforme TaxID=150365 RepID=A0AAQ3R7A6_9PEZI|nr:Hypothetical protein R9X50_00327800 [Acrodontium crateriforme]
MRIPIREQLTGIIFLTSLICLGVVSIATWVTERSFTLNVRSSRLTLTASLKAAQLTSNLNLMQNSVNFVTTRILIQRALSRYNHNGNNTQANWISAQADLEAGIGGDGSLGAAVLLQAMVFGINDSGPGGPYGLLNATLSTANNTLQLPYTCPDGSNAYLGDNNACGNNLGYPPQMYPNLTFSTEPYNSTFRIPTANYEGVTLKPGSSLLIGPWQLNQTFSLISITLPIINNTSAVDVLGWLTVIMDASLVLDVVESTQGLDQTGEVLLVGPVNKSNVFTSNVLYSKDRRSTHADFPVHYIIPVSGNETSRHPNKTLGMAGASFNATQYPAVFDAFTMSTGQTDNSGANIKTTNEAGMDVSVGYALVQTKMVNWAVVIEQARSEVWAPINHLRNILLACVFGTAAFMAIVAFPLAHFFSLPIRRLREATTKSIEPPGIPASRSSIGSFGSLHDGTRDLGVAETSALTRKEGMRHRHRGGLFFWRKSPELDDARSDRRRKQEFRIPRKVKERKTWVKDELSDLTYTFNEMSDELMMQYSKLEERVQQRTAELETSKLAAEAANESKTLFIANISHELKTPLNGILGMCAVCMQEDDPIRLKRSLGIIYKSGDLLLNLLTDLLTFSKNQVGQHLSLDEKEFRLRDVSSQILAIFDKQAKEGQIDLRIAWEGVDDISCHDQKSQGPTGFGRVKDMILWGDIHRILQVVINLVSNSLKFTPPGGTVTLTIRCLPDMMQTDSRTASMTSRQSKISIQQSSRKGGSTHTLSLSKPTTPNSGYPRESRERPRTLGKLHLNASSERTASPPPGKLLLFEFEVNDTGPGIPENLQSKIFEPFVQGDLGLSKKFGGTGLGLSICSQLAKLMNGSVGVQSTVGVGSTFTMRMPLKHLQTHADSSASSTIDFHSDAPKRSESMESKDRIPSRRSVTTSDDPEDVKARSRDLSPSHSAQRSTAAVADSQPRLVGLSQPFFASSQPMESPGSQPGAMKRIEVEAKRGGKIRVLVAEDNQVNQEVVLRMLKLEDVYDVTVAKDGQEALDIVKESMTAEDGRPFNLIFMDVQMPNVDGLQSTRLIREIGYQAPIVALTAFAEESNIKDCMDSGMNYFLSKPIRRPQLKKVLKEYCAPIPEENEDLTPPPTTDTSPILPSEPLGNTTIVMVNGPQLPAGTVKGGIDSAPKQKEMNGHATEPSHSN